MIARKVIALLTACCLFFSMAACAKNSASNASESSGEAVTSISSEPEAAALRVVATIFPPYDFSREIADGSDLSLSMLLPPGSESHSFEPTPQDIITIQNCDVFIYNGGASDAWVDAILDSMDTSNMTILKMMDMVDVVEEEVVEGMQDDQSDDTQADTSDDTSDGEHGSAASAGASKESQANGIGEGAVEPGGSEGVMDSEGNDVDSEGTDADSEKNDDAGNNAQDNGVTEVETIAVEAGLQAAVNSLGKEQDNEPEYDEHVWTSPVNAQKIVTRISEAFIKADPDNAQLYQENTEEYIRALQDLDKDFRKVVASGARRTLVFGDRFPFRYFADEYGLDYSAAFPGCSTETEPSVSTVTFLIEKMEAEDIPVVFYIEFSNEKMADSICESTGAEKRLLHSCHNVSTQDINAGVSYLSLMRQNVDALEGALS